MPLKHISLRQFRGIGKETQYLRDLKKINLFVGENNAGKSTILTLVSKYLPIRFEGNSPRTKTRIEEIDRYQDPAYHNPIIGFALSRSEVLEKLRSLNNIIDREPRIAVWLQQVLDHLSDDHELIWWTTDILKQDRFILERKGRNFFNECRLGQGWIFLQDAYTQYRGGSPDEAAGHFMDALRDHISIASPKTHLIPAIRQIGPKTSGFDLGDMTGTGLINRLAEIQNPDLEHLSEKAIFNKINKFLKSVTGRQESEIEIPNSRDYILVHMNGRILPLSSLGTGIHEIIMIASYCTLVQKDVVCIEEPEIHLHPILQRKLIRYLSEQTDNQYFIATHSAAFIDTPGASVHRVYLDNEETRISETILDKDRYEICVDLGYKASDIVQTNAIIWVEGPSDRIYINHWLRSVDVSLVEGTHYVIMFYGGRLLSHLSAGDDEVDEFIKLRALNRNVAIVMDSDKETAHKGVNGTKRRIQQEFRDHGGIAWLTQGREIENYVQHSALQDAVKEISSSRYHSAAGGGQFDHALWYYEMAQRSKSAPKRRGALIKEVDKVKVARLVATKAARLDVLDLRQRVSEIAQMIRSANRH